MSNNRKVDAARNRLKTKHCLTRPEKTICLTMIVKNESKNMVRLLNSVKSIIDCISIVDTGSTDDTPDVIKNWCINNKIKYAIHHEPFKNFAYNRTHSVQMAQKTYPDVDYLLLSDADFVWEINTGGIFNKRLLYDHKYLVNQYNTTISYDNIRLLSAKVDWECLCLTHEYWSECKVQRQHVGEIRTHTLTTIKINDLEDGGCKTDKFVRDERLLLEGLSDPDLRLDHKIRYTFYLAQTYKCLGNYESSIEYYKKRIEYKGWAEEVYISYYQIGKCYDSMSDIYKKVIDLTEKKTLTENEQKYINEHNKNNLPIEELYILWNKINDNAIKWYVDGWIYRPSRAESLYHATALTRKISRHEDSYKYALIGKKIMLSNDTLFVEPKCYAESWCYDYEISIICFYLKDKKQEGADACLRLLDRTDLPEDIRQRTEQNCKFYI